ncbi:MAG: ribosome small subunit-dependent GTPase A [Lachnospiraceae bacterium]|nr:ribosome small subunit-dependent GTPase A [Lachnospiraceae bacterium]MBQ9935049.1 ribosome small subunit-dependent GTPase A [Lachnospiraceae bacterium]
MQVNVNGKIIKGVGGFYYIHLPDNRIFECKAKGVFRNQNIKPTVGDNVLMNIIDEQALTGNISDILPRENSLIRPMVSNVDQAVIIFALSDPKPNFNLLDRFLIMMDRQDVKTIICFNKADLVPYEEADKLKSIYEACGYDVIITSTYSRESLDSKESGVEALQTLIKGKTTVFAGPSGVGKSSLLNALNPNANVQTGSISEKIKRGKHTTRHSELIWVGEETYIMDTPGFSSLFVDEMECEDLKDYYYEFVKHQESCRFNGCVHINEPNCGVKKALEEGTISKLRYDNYKQLYEELKNKKKW